VKSKYYGIRSRRSSRLFALGLLLIPCCLTFACRKSPPEYVAPETARLVICKAPNDIQSRSWNLVVELAEDYPELYRDGVEWSGSHLARCGFTE